MPLTRPLPCLAGEEEGKGEGEREEEKWRKKDREAERRSGTRAPRIPRPTILLGRNQQVPLKSAGLWSLKAVTNEGTRQKVHLATNEGPIKMSSHSHSPD